MVTLTGICNRVIKRAPYRGPFYYYGRGVTPGVAVGVVTGETGFGVTGIGAGVGVTPGVTGFGVTPGIGVGVGTVLG